MGLFVFLPAPMIATNTIIPTHPPFGGTGSLVFGGDGDGGETVRSVGRSFIHVTLVCQIVVVVVVTMMIQIIIYCTFKP